MTVASLIYGYVQKLEAERTAKMVNDLNIELSHVKQETEKQRKLAEEKAAIARAAQQEAVTQYKRAEALEKKSRK